MFTLYSDECAVTTIKAEARVRVLCTTRQVSNVNKNKFKTELFSAFSLFVCLCDTFRLF